MSSHAAIEACVVGVICAPTEAVRVPLDDIGEPGRAGQRAPEKRSRNEKARRSLLRRVAGSSPPSAPCSSAIALRPRVPTPYRSGSRMTLSDLVSRTRARRWSSVMHRRPRERDVRRQVRVKARGTASPGCEDVLGSPAQRWRIRAALRPDPSLGAGTPERGPDRRRRSDSRRRNQSRDLSSTRGDLRGPSRANVISPLFTHSRSVSSIRLPSRSIASSASRSSS